jgi:hypothetical protein
MPRATLIIDVDTSAVRRAMGEVQSLTRRAQAAMTADATRGTSERTRAVRRGATAETAAARQVQRDRRAAENAATAVVRATSAERIATAGRESRERTAIAIAAVRAATTMEVERTRAHTREEIARTNATRREEQRRTEAVRYGRREQQSRMAGLARAGVATVYRTGVQEHGQIQDARQRSASTDAALAGAVGLAGGDANEAAARARQLHAFAEANRLPSAGIAEAAAAGQAEFNVLGQRGQSVQQRDAQFRAFLADYAEGANTFADPSQHVRLSGMLRSGGFDESTRQSALSVIGAATQAGSVEEGDLIRGGMSAMIARMRGARQQGGETMQQAQLRELTEAVTEMEVAKSSGLTARMSGNILRNVGQRLRGTVAQDKLLTNVSQATQTAGLTAEQQARLQATLFEVDPTREGRMRLRERYQSGVGLAEGAAAAGITGQQFQNVFAGGGYGNAQGLQRNEQNLLGGLLNRDAEGRTGVEAIRAMQGAGGITAADRERLAGVRQGTDAATLAGQEEHALNARRNNLAAGMSDTTADFIAIHPVLTSAVQGLTGLATSVGGWMGMRAALGYSATTAATGAAGGAAATGAATTGAGALATVGGMVLAPLAAAAAILLHTRSDNDSTDINAEGLRRARAGGSATGPVQVSLTPESAAAVASAMRQAPITAAVTPHDAAHAASAAAPQARR